MANIFQSRFSNTLVAYLTTVAFTAATLISPPLIMVGVTVTLCGLFLAFVPLPGCQAAGFWLVNAGVGILGGEALHKWDQYDRDKKSKK